MQKLWQKKLKLNYSKDVIDIVQFGSSIIEESNPNDIDIAVIFRDIPLKEQLEEGQRIKKQLQELSELPIHLENFTLSSLFQQDNFAREGIVFYGKSISNQDNFAKRFGLTPILKIAYTLSDLKKKDKIRFNYLLNGKSGNYGLLRKYKGQIIAPGVLETLPENELIFTREMKKITDKIRVEKMFISIP